MDLLDFLNALLRNDETVRTLGLGRESVVEIEERVKSTDYVAPEASVRRAFIREEMNTVNALYQNFSELSKR